MVGRKADVDVMPVAQLQLLGYSSHEIQSSGVAAAGVSCVILSAPFFFFFFFLIPGELLFSVNGEVVVPRCHCVHRKHDFIYVVYNIIVHAVYLEKFYADTSQDRVISSDTSRAVNLNIFWHCRHGFFKNIIIIIVKI